MKKTNKKGFTIVELVIVIAVIAILAGVLIPTFSGVITKANESEALQVVRNAYVATIADELATPDTTDDTITNALKSAAIIVKYDETLIQISQNGEASVVSSGADTYKVENGKIVAKSGT